MACKFIIPFAGNASEILSKARTAIEGQGGVLDGDETQGNFDVTVLGSTIKGSYSITGKDMDLEITSKPFFVPCSTIESFLRNKLGK
jgi:hypothetical protein